MAETAALALKVVAKWLATEGLKQAIVKAAIQVAITATAAKLAADANKPRPQGSLITTDLSGDAPRRIQIGKRGNGGVLADWYTSGNKNQFAYMPTYLGEGPMGNLTGIWSQGRKIWSGTLTHGQRIQLTEFDSPDGRAWVTYYDGRPGQVADANLVGKGLGWTNQCVGTGCAYVIIELKWDPDTVPLPPPMFFETEGAKFYDRRLDTTAGGSGSHRLKNPSTWALSTNPAVVLDHYLLGRFLDVADTEPIMGPGLDPADVPFDRFAALANLCDEQVALKTPGTQNRYDANGFIFSDSAHKDVIFDLGRAMNARPADIGGRLTMIGGETRTPVLTLDDGDLVEGTQDEYSPKLSGNQLVQTVRGTYQDVSNNYTPTDYPRVGDPAWIIEDGGEVEPTTLDLEMETSVARAQRLATLYARRKRRQATLTGVYGMKALILEDGDWFIRTGARFPGGKTFEVNGSPRLDLATMNVVINAFEVDPADVAWDEQNEVEPTPSTPAVTVPTRLPIPNVSVAAAAYGFGSVQIPVIRFTNNDAGDGAPTQVDIEIADNDGGGGPTGERVAHFIAIGQASSIATGLLPGKNYVVRWRSVLGANSSVWSAWSTITTTANFTAGGVPWAGVTGSARPADNADVTAANIALGFTGEGSLARLSQVDWGLHVIGSARPADNADVTGSNVAAAIAGQGGQATANATRGDTASRPASPPEGSWYSNTQTSELQFYTGGSWRVVSNISTGAGMIGSRSPATVQGFSTYPATATTTGMTASATGHTGSLTYQWGSHDPAVGIQSPTSATTIFSRVPGNGGAVNAAVFCDITDSTGATVRVGGTAQFNDLS